MNDNKITELAWIRTLLAVIRTILTFIIFILQILILSRVTNGS